MEKMPKKLSSSHHWPLREGGCRSLGDVFIHPAEKTMGHLSIGEGTIDRRVLVPRLRFPFWVNSKLPQENPSNKYFPKQATKNKFSII